jgi:WXG100 family type VII secretion target
VIVSVESVITKHLPGFPEGNPGELRVAASYWTSVAGGLRTLIDDTQGRIGSLSSSWQGGAKTAFEQEWTTLANAVQQGCEEMGGVATALHQAADKLENAQHAYEVAVGAAAVTAVVGIAATFITFGASDAADVPVIEAEVAAATEVAAEATAAASTAFSAAVTIAQQIAVRFVVYLGVDLTAQAAISTVVFPDHNPFGHLNLDSAISVALGMAAAPELPGASGLVKVAVGGAAGGGSDALSQLITTGKIDPGEVLFNGALGAAGAGVMVGTGGLLSRLEAADAEDVNLADSANVPGAESAANGPRLQAQLSGEEIAGGHAFDKHVIQRGEFPGVTTRAQFAQKIQSVILNGEPRELSRGRMAYWDNGVFVVRDPNHVDGGTAFVPRTGYSYFLRQESPWRSK